MTKQTYHFGFVILLFFLSSIYIVVFSKSGILERNLLKAKNRTIDNRIQSLIKYNISLFDKLEKLQNKLYSEQELIDAGYIARHQKVIFLNGIKDDIQYSENISVDKNNYYATISQYRIIVIVGSILILLLYYTRRPVRNDIKESD